MSTMNLCRFGTKCATKAINAKVLKALDEGYEKLLKSNSKSLLKKFLTPELFKSLRTVTTKNANLLDCIQSGLANHDSYCGVYASEPEAYTAYNLLFHPIIESQNMDFRVGDCQPEIDFGDPKKFEQLDPERHYIGSTRIRCCRNIDKIPFNACMKKSDFIKVEKLVTKALCSLEEHIDGIYYPLSDMSESRQKELVKQGVLFKDTDRFLKAANGRQFWPVGRGIYYNLEKSFAVWCNEEDHIRIISMEQGSNFCSILTRLIQGMEKLQEQLTFVRHERYGFLTFCPTNVGTTIRASVHIRLPKLSTQKKILQEIADCFKLEIRKIGGKNTSADGSLYDISNKRRLGVTEFLVIKEMYDGVAELIKMEKQTKQKN